jgi:succinoglycan biosynthesis transport protein ExoP
MATEHPKGQRGGLLIQIQYYWHVLLKWKWTAIFFCLAAVIVAVGYSFLVTPVYTAHGSIWIEDNPNILPFEDVQALGADTSLESHARLLRSRFLAADTITKLKLFENPDFAGKPKRGRKAPDPNDPIARERLIDSLLANTKVTVGARTRLVDVQCTNRNPKLATEILNSLFDGFIRMMIRKKYAASEQATAFLNTQVTELRTEIERKERELNQYGAEKDIMPLTAAEAPSVSRIAEVNKALTDATIDRINKYNAFNQLKAAPLGEIPNAPEGSLVQRLRTDYITLNRQYVTRLATVRPEFPAMQRLKSEVDAAAEALKNETQNLIRIASTDYQAALDKEQSLQRLLNSLKSDAYKANSNSVVYNSLKIDLDNKKALLESISKRQSETDVSSRLEDLDTLNVWIVDKADYPITPSFPNKQTNVLLGLLLGLAGGVGAALGLEYLNHTVKTSKDVMNSIGVPTLGTVPAFEAEVRMKGPVTEFAKIVSLFKGQGERMESKISGHRGARASRSFTGGRSDARSVGGEPGNPRIELIASREPQSIQAESYRSVRTTLFVSSPPGRIKTILFTSPLAKEGKSATVSNLGITFAEAGKHVVIVDSDLRKPKQARIFGILSGSGPGLSQYLSSNTAPGDIVQPSRIPNLSVITSGPLPANPIELLTSEKMDSLVAYLRQRFDFVMFDTPPLLAVSDALAMGPMADAIILIVRGGLTPIPALKQAKQKLDAHKLKCLGVVLNGVDLLEQDGYYAKQYYHYSKAE